MSNKMILGFSALVICLLSTACDKTCKTTVQDVTPIENLTGRQMMLSFCKNGMTTGEVILNLSPDRHSTEVTLGTRDEMRVQGGATALEKCESKEETNQEDILLSSKSAGLVRLCRDQSSVKYIIIENYQICPTGFVEPRLSGNCI